MKIGNAIGLTCASIFLILSPILISYQERESRGLEVSIASPAACGTDDGRTVIVWVRPAGQIRLNAKDVPRAELERRLEEIYRTRATHVIFVKGEGDVAYQDVMEVVDTASKYADYVAVLPPDVTGCFTIRLSKSQIDASRAKSPVRMKEVLLWDIAREQLRAWQRRVLGR